jgi:phenylalanyl-tRNA synthetase alpha chain
MPSDIQPLPNYSEATIVEAFSHLLLDLESDAASVLNDEQIETFRLRWDGRKQGRLPDISGIWLKGAPDAATRKLVGEQFAKLKTRFIEELNRAKMRFVLGVYEKATIGDRAVIESALRDRVEEDRKQQIEKNRIDITLPGTVRAPGIPHPLLKTMHEIVQVFHHLGYSTNLGPQVESDFYNFEALNFPPNHPARDTQDTLLIAAQQSRPSRDRLLMRTHTSPVQIRTMIAQAPPIRIVIPGKVHRNDAADATHSPIFHQVEGLCVDTNITFSDLKGTLDHAMKALFGSDVKTRFFPSFFPFTEPSADVQISCIFCGGKGCRKCKHSGWIELLGCGMVDPAVFAAVTEERRKFNPSDDAYNPEKITGFAFGMGVERIAMIQHGISDIGHFYSGDMRFLEQFA